MQRTLAVSHNARPDVLTFVKLVAYLHIGIFAHSHNFIRHNTDMPCSVTLAWRFICAIAEHPVACLPQLAVRHHCIRMRSRQFRWKGEVERHKCNLLLIYSSHRHAKWMYVVLHVLRAAGNAEFYWLLCLMKLWECANMPICKYATNLTNVMCWCKQSHVWNTVEVWWTRVTIVALKSATNEQRH